MFTISDEPEENKSVLVTAKVHGTCNHSTTLEPKPDSSKYKSVENYEVTSMTRLHKRPLKGLDRQKVASTLIETRNTSSNLYYTWLSEMKTEELDAGNITYCQKPDVFRQTVSQYKKQHQFAYDMTQDVHIQMEAWKASLHGKNVHGFVQGLGINPFYAVLYVEEQVNIFLQSVKRTEGCVLHFDSTGKLYL